MFDKIVDIIANFKLFLSAFLPCGLVAFLLLIYLNPPNHLIAFFLVFVLGIVLGAMLVNRIAKKGSTHDYLSQINATPDIDDEVNSSNK